MNKILIFKVIKCVKSFMFIQTKIVNVHILNYLHITFPEWNSHLIQPNHSISIVSQLARIHLICVCVYIYIYIYIYIYKTNKVAVAWFNAYYLQPNEWSLMLKISLWVAGLVD